MPKVPATPAYQKLIRIIQKELREGTRLAEEDVRRRRVLTYWNIGGHIDDYLSHTDGSKRNETPHLQKIAGDMDYSLDVIRKILKFYRCYPGLSSRPQLSWTQYRALLTAPDSTRRNLKARAIREGLGSEKLYQIISGARRSAREKTPGLKEDGTGRLAVIRGRLFRYKTLQSQSLRLKKNEIMVDCGFKIRHKVDIPWTSRLTGGTLVLSVKAQKRYILKQSSKNDTALYTYAARPARVVDADTLLLSVDVGFDIWLDIRARLRGIDAPEMTTHAGYRARQFVAAQLKRSKAVVIKTYRKEKFGRYLVDVFYMEGGGSDPARIARDGIFLNQRLLDEGLAALWRG